MMIDYLTLMLINMSAGLFLLGCFVWRDLDTPEDVGHWVPAFAISGLVATIGGFAITFTWPLIGQLHIYNAPFGEMSVLLGVLFLGLALALSKRWGLLPLAIYAFFAGLAAAVLGIRIIEQKLTAAPLLSGIGFILCGACGIFSPLAVWQKHKKELRILGTLVLFAASAIWALTGYLAYWIHLTPPK
jgi:putative membrane protein